MFDSTPIPTGVKTGDSLRVNGRVSNGIININSRLVVRQAQERITRTPVYALRPGLTDFAITVEVVHIGPVEESADCRWQ